MSKLVAALMAVVFACWFMPPTHDALVDASTAIADRFDRRPARQILLIGNSRTYYNRMPAMLRAIADSAHSPERFAITTRALPGGSLEESWNDAETQGLLHEHWNDVVVQAESRAHGAPERQASFFTFGGKLIAAAAPTPVTLIVNWTYGEELFAGDPGARIAYHAQIQSDHARLSLLTGATLANVGSVWERVHATAPTLPLTVDGNHPTVQGSFLAALVLYARLAQRDVADVTFVPSGMSTEEADIIRSQVSEMVGETLIFSH